MSQNMYDANGNFVAGSYLDGMWSGPPGTGINPMRPMQSENYQGAVQQGLMGQSPPRWEDVVAQGGQIGPRNRNLGGGTQPSNLRGDVDFSKQFAELDAKRGSSVGPQPFNQPTGGGSGGFGSPAGGQQNINLGQVGLTFSPSGTSGAATNGYNKWQFAQGGSIPQGIASLGRGQDSMLVHMTPGEVQGLQQLAMKHGGSLTINPQTGLPEAGILSTLLPMAAGFALGPAGFQLMSSLGAAATVGGLGALATGSLGKGLKYGLGAYGGSELGGSLMGMGEAAIGNPAMAGNLTDASNAMPQMGMDSMPTPNLYNDALNAKQAAIQKATFGEKLTSGLGAVKDNPLAFAKNNLVPLAAASAPLVSNMLQQQPTLANLPKQSFPYQTYDYNPGNVNPNFGQLGQPYFLDQGYTRTGAEGGLFHNTADEAYPQARLPLQHMAAGGLEDAQEYAAGGKLLRGAGDGMSDSIPAVIKGARPQRAALADGEFVIPADVVSHLGNGSTEAGAKRLYAMMDKVRHARTGNKKQGRQISPERFMPA